MDQLELGLTLVIDYNEERHIHSNNAKNGSTSEKQDNFNHNKDNSFTMYLDTIGINISTIMKIPNGSERVSVAFLRVWGGVQGMQA